MQLVDSLEQLSDRRVALGRATLRALGLTARAQLALCATATANGALAVELIASPVPFAAWGELWRLPVTVRDRPGAVNRVLRVVDALGCQVRGQGSVTIDAREHHRIDLILDARDDASPTDGDSEARWRDPRATLGGLRDWLVESCIDHVRLDPGGQPELRIDRLGELHDTFRDARAAADDPQRPSPLQARARVRLRWVIAQLNAAPAAGVRALAVLSPEGHQLVSSTERPQITGTGARTAWEEIPYRLPGVVARVRAHQPGLIEGPDGQLVAAYPLRVGGWWLVVEADRAAVIGD